jgi:hypothetical protein
VSAQAEDGDDVIGVLHRLEVEEERRVAEHARAAAANTAPSRQWAVRSRRTARGDQAVLAA